MNDKVVRFVVAFIVSELIYSPLTYYVSKAVWDVLSSVHADSSILVLVAVLFATIPSYFTAKALA